MPFRSTSFTLFRFHALGAARVAQRNALLTIAVAIFLVGSAPGSTAQIVRHLTLSLVGREGPVATSIAVALLATALAAGATPTIMTGLGGWIRSLPLSGAQHRRALTLALLIPMLPLLAFELLAAAAVSWGYDRPLAPVKLLGLPIALFAAAAAVVPSRAGIVARPLAAVAALLAVRARWELLGLASVMLLAGDLIAGPLALPPRTTGGSRPVIRWLGVRLALRAIGWRAAGTLVIPALLIGFAHLYRINNEYSIGEAAPALRICALAGTTLLLAALADLLLVRRPVWPWARSLPMSARRRVVDDAALLAAATLVPLVLVFREDWRTALVVLAALPLLVVQASGAVRRGRGRMTRAGGEVVALGVAVVAAVSVWPLASLLCLAATPVALIAAERADRGTPATAWHELHHSVAGDSLSLSAG